MAEGLLAGERTRFESLLESRPIGRAAPKVRGALGRLPREGERKSWTILENPRLRLGGKPPFVEPLVAKQQPGESLGRPLSVRVLYPSDGVGEVEVRREPRCGLYKDRAATYNSSITVIRVIFFSG